jgi:hypothetical protein
MNTNTKFPHSNVPMHNKFGVHMPPVYRVIKPNEIPAEKAVEDEGEPELSDIYPLQWTSSFSHDDVSSNKQTATSSNTFVLNDYIKKA